LETGFLSVVEKFEKTCFGLGYMKILYMGFGVLFLMFWRKKIWKIFLCNRDFSTSKLNIIILSSAALYCDWKSSSLYYIDIYKEYSMTSICDRLWQKIVLSIEMSILSGEKHKPSM